MKTKYVSPQTGSVAYTPQSTILAGSGSSSGSRITGLVSGGNTGGNIEFAW